MKLLHKMQSICDFFFNDRYRVLGSRYCWVASFCLLLCRYRVLQVLGSRYWVASFWLLSRYRVRGTLEPVGSVHCVPGTVFWALGCIILTVIWVKGMGYLFLGTGLHHFDRYLNTGYWVLGTGLHHFDPHLGTYLANFNSTSKHPPAWI